MLDASSRLLRLLSLLQSRHEWSGADLAESLGVTTRTVRRDIDRLRELGYRIDSVPGVAGGYRLSVGNRLPPLLLTDEEAVAIAVGLRTAAGGTVHGIEEFSVQALAKLERVLPVRLRHQVRAFQSTMVPLTASAGPTIDPDLLTQLATSCYGHERVSFDYVNSRGGQSERRVEPYRLVYTSWRWYLLAYDLDKDDWRTFRVDRVRGPVRPGHRFTPRELPADDIRAYVSRAVSYRPYRYQATILLRAPVRQLAEGLPPTAGHLEAVDESSCLLRTGANSLDKLALYIGLMGADFEVLEPAELRDHVRALADRFARGGLVTAEPDRR
ncbi:helix-turn-helix transcriptional regulator [Thermoactinospora rubra]|uniref:helix-turn-helix transcriptional regulator n=1 Tax=Thermoactinospora rubra TaxID=1088767 RepID=UPI000A1228A6|nr:YafY family protein [Thermoactinospora rubra]